MRCFPGDGLDRPETLNENSFRLRELTLSLAQELEALLLGVLCRATLCTPEGHEFFFVGGSWTGQV